MPELWRLRGVSKAFSRFCAAALAQTAPVLVAGGLGCSVGDDGTTVSALDSADVLEWGRMRWVAVAPMKQRRFAHAMCPLPGGALPTTKPTRVRTTTSDIVFTVCFHIIRNLETMHD